MKDAIRTLKDVDQFHKNCLLLFDDLISLIREKGSVKNLV